MNLTVIASGDNVFKNCEYIKGYAFKMAEPRVKYAFLASYDAILRSKSTRATAYFALLQDKYAHTAVLNASYHTIAS